LLEMSIQYNKQYDMSNICLLPVNMYGPEDNFDSATSHVIPALIRKIQIAKDHNDGHVDIWGTGHATREFLYVKDFAGACTNACFFHGSINDPINIGTGSEVRILDLACAIKYIVGYGGELRFDPSMPDGQPRRCLNVERAREVLGWQPTTHLNQGLDATYQWYMENIR